MGRYVVCVVVAGLAGYGIGMLVGAHVSDTTPARVFTALAGYFGTLFLMLRLWHDYDN